MSKYIVASSRDWFRSHPKSCEFKSLNIIEIFNKEELTLERLRKVNPRYIFFPHWNWKVKPEIFKQYECVVFHTAPLPYGRGGSPIQNLIIRNIKKSPVCALKMTEVLDGGPIYDSIDIELDGTICEILARASLAIEALILKICKEEPRPSEQSGEIEVFKRLKYSDNELKTFHTPEEIYDRIRMVDGAGYPKAYINFGNHKIEFSEARLKNNGEIYAKIKLNKNVD